MPWDPKKYEQFRDQRSAPFVDLAALIEPKPGLRVIDLGCGTGELTARLADLLPGSDVLGVDSSAEMLAGAAKLAKPGLRFEVRAIEDVAGEWDVVFSHAALHWVEDHEALVPRIAGLVAAGGQIAVQVPSNHDHPTHRLIVEAAGEEPFRTALGGWTRRAPVLGIDEYASILFAQGFEAITAFEKVYAHVIEDADGLVDWVQGTALVPYMERLGDRGAAFLERYRAKVRDRYPERPVFYPFKRTLFAATRPA